MRSQKVGLFVLTAAACSIVFIIAVTPLQSQSNVRTMDIASLRQKGDAGDAAAQSEIGGRYAQGIGGVPKDIELALKWLQKAADQGDAPAQNYLGFIFSGGHGIPQDIDLALKWYQKAADQGLNAAQQNLGMLYMQGTFVPQDYSLAFGLFQKAADQGEAAAQDSLGIMYRDGLGVPQDYARARKWFQKAADQGFAAAQVRLKELNTVQEPSCDPTWSPKFSQITFGGFDNSPAAVRQITDQQIAKYGGVDRSITQVESERASYQQQLVQQQNDGNANGVNQLQQLILFSDGMLDVLRCRQQISRQTNAVPPGPSQGSTGSAGVAGGPTSSGNAERAASPKLQAQIDLRYLQVESRPLTDAEMTAVRNLLRWDPESVPLAPGGTARSNLVDDKGRSLGSVLVRWEKPTTPRTTQTSGQSRATFTVQVENRTSCVFQSSAELDDSQGFIVVSGVTWSGWLTLHQPDRGQTSQVKGDAALPQAYTSLSLKPLTPYSTLSACMTPKNQ